MEPVEIGPELAEWIKTEGGAPQLVSWVGELIDHRTLDGRVLLVEYRPIGKYIQRA